MNFTMASEADGANIFQMIKPIFRGASGVMQYKVSSAINTLDGRRFLARGQESLNRPWKRGKFKSKQFNRGI